MLHPFQRYVKCGMFTMQLETQRHKVTHVFGPSVAMQSPCYGSSEYYIAIPYFNGDPNTDFKVVPIDGVTEYLDVRSNVPSERVLSAVRTIYCIPALCTHPCRSGSLRLEGITSPS